MAERMKIRQYVQSGKSKTVREVVRRFGDGRLVKANFGWMIHLNNWAIEKFKANPIDLAECKGTDQCPASMRMGETIVTRFLNSNIRVKTAWPLNSRSGNLAPVKKGICGRCGKKVTSEMQDDLAQSNEVRCEGCSIWLFGPGE
jgi:hypothetical protein